MGVGIGTVIFSKNRQGTTFNCIYNNKTDCYKTLIPSSSSPVGIREELGGNGLLRVLGHCSRKEAEENPKEIIE